MTVTEPPKFIANDEGEKRQCPYCLDLYEQHKDGKHEAEVADSQETLTEYIMRCHRCNRKQYFAGGYLYNPKTEKWFRVGPHKMYIHEATGEILCVNCAGIFDELIPWDWVPEEELISPEEDREEERAKYYE